MYYEKSGVGVRETERRQSLKKIARSMHNIDNIYIVYELYYQVYSVLSYMINLNFSKNNIQMNIIECRSKKII